MSTHKTVTVEVDSQEVVLKIKEPTLDQRIEADKVKNATFREALESGAYLKNELKKVLKERGQWSDKTDAELESLEKKISEGVERLNEGGFDLDEAVDLAWKINGWRMEMVELLTVFASATDMTAEGQADNASFDYLVSCMVYNQEDKPFFKNYEDYKNKKGEPYSYTIASKVYEVLNHSIDDNSIASLPENQFLIEYGLVDKKLRRINDKGELVNSKGERIDEEGYRINKDGKRIDRYGNLLDENNRPIIKRKPFLKDGKPIKKKSSASEKPKDE